MNLKNYARQYNALALLPRSFCAVRNSALLGDNGESLMVNEKQKQILQHMLGADSRYLKKQWGFRNHYCAGDNKDCSDRLELEKMQRDGLVKSGDRIGSTTFWATKKGAESIGFKAYQLRNTNLAA